MYTLKLGQFLHDGRIFNFLKLLVNYTSSLGALPDFLPNYAADERCTNVYFGSYSLFEEGLNKLKSRGKFSGLSPQKDQYSSFLISTLT